MGKRHLVKKHHQTAREITFSPAQEGGRVVGRLDFTMDCYLALIAALAEGQKAEEPAGKRQLSHWVK